MVGDCVQSLTVPWLVAWVCNGDCSLRGSAGVVAEGVSGCDGAVELFGPCGLAGLDGLAM